MIPEHIRDLSKSCLCEKLLNTSLYGAQDHQSTSLFETQSHQSQPCLLLFFPPRSDSSLRFISLSSSHLSIPTAHPYPCHRWWPCRKLRLCVSCTRRL